MMLRSALVGLLLGVWVNSVVLTPDGGPLVQQLLEAFRERVLGFAAGAAVTPKLHYFDARGRAEALRVAFADKGVEFEEVSFGVAEWGKGRPDGIKARMGKDLMFGQVPALQIDGMFLVQSHSIFRYVSRKYQWYRSYSSATLARIDMLADGTEDVRKQLTGIKYDGSLSEEDKSLKYAVWCQESAPLWLGYFETAIQDTSSEFAAGTSDPTHADYLLYDLLDTMEALVGAEPSKQVLAGLPALSAWRIHMNAREAIRAYLSSPKRRAP